MAFFELSRRHYTPLYVQPFFAIHTIRTDTKKASRMSICSLNIIPILTAKSSSAAYIHQL